MPRRHLLFVLTGEVADRVQALRREWDPVMAVRIPPHVTLVYPEEANDCQLLLQRVADAAAQTAPFLISPGALEESNVGGVWFRVEDPAGGVSRLRAAILRPPFQPYPVIPHVTVVHPRTSKQGPQALKELSSIRIDGSARLDEILLTETGVNGTAVLDRFPLSPGPAYEPGAV